MVSCYNSISYPQKPAYPAGQPPWFPPNYHPQSNHQFLSNVDSHHHNMYYNAHPMFHQSANDWHAPDNYQPSQMAHHMIPLSGGNTHLNESTGSSSAVENNNNNNNLAEALPSPPITVSGSEISSPGAPASSSSPHANLNGNNNHHHRSSPGKNQYYEWMKKPAYPAQPTPGKTRTKDKYRVVYTDFQRLELEKEYCSSKYITIRRKTELAQSLQLSERQVKIWFQNRRAKERKQTKKRDDPIIGHSPDLVNFMDTKPKIEPGLHLQHQIHHQMSSMAAMGMSPMSLHHSVLHHGHHPLAVPPSQHLHQPM